MKSARFTFDPVKRDRCLAERGLDFADAAEVFDAPTISKPDQRHVYGEERIQTVGFLAGRMVMIVWTPRNESRRIISMRYCNDREKAYYGSQP